MPLELVPYSPQPEPLWFPQTPIPRPLVLLFWPLTAAEKPPGLVLVMVPSTAVAFTVVSPLFPATAVPSELVPRTATPPVLAATPSTPAPDPAVRLLL